MQDDAYYAILTVHYSSRYFLIELQCLNAIPNKTGKSLRGILWS